MSTGSRGHPIIINGIDELVMQPGLADRCLFVNAAPVSDRQRRSLLEIGATFEKMRPKILGALLDAVAHGLRALPTTRLDELPRMADFAKWVTACEGALWPTGKFMAAYLENRAEAAEKLIEGDILASAVRTFMAKRPPWSGTATDLDIELRVATGNLEGANGWPASPRILATRLRELEPRLRKAGVTMEFDLRTGHNRDRMMRIARMPDQADGAPEASPTSSAASAERGDEGGPPESGGSEPMTSVEEPESIGTADSDGADQPESEPETQDAADASIRADAADDEITDKSVRLVRSVVIRGRQILVCKRHSWSRNAKKHARHGDGSDPAQTQLIDRWYDGEAGEIRGRPDST